MIAYFLKRLLLFVPVLFLISLLVFFLSKLSSGDPVLNKLERESKRNGQNQLQELIKTKKELKLDLANFYFNIHRKTSCPNPNSYPTKQIVNNLESIAFEVGSWEKAEQFYLKGEALLNKRSISDEAKAILWKLRKQKGLSGVKEQLSLLKAPEFRALKEGVDQMEKAGFSWNNYLPRFRWNGTKNQFHHWFFNLVRGNFGTSYLDGSSVKGKVSQSLYWTLIISCFSLVLSFLIAIPTAVYSAANPNSFLDRFCSFLFFGFYALPVFWVGTLAVVFFCAGDFFSLFPPYGLGQIDARMSFWEIFYIRGSHLMLPILCSTYVSLAFIYRQLRGSMLEELTSNYARAAKAKGISQSQLLWKHAFRNASFPLFTILGNALPYVVSGSFVIEYIFAIPGIGKLTIDSFTARDFPILFTIILLISVMTLLGSWLADVTYHIADPRFKINSSQNK